MVRTWYISCGVFYTGIRCTLVFVKFSAYTLQTRSRPYPFCLLVQCNSPRSLAMRTRQCRQRPRTGNAPSRPMHMRSLQNCVFFLWQVVLTLGILSGATPWLHNSSFSLLRGAASASSDDPAIPSTDLRQQASSMVSARQPIAGGRKTCGWLRIGSCLR